MAKEPFTRLCDRADRKDLVVEIHYDGEAITVEVRDRKGKKVAQGTDRDLREATVLCTSQLATSGRL